MNTVLCILYKIKMIKFRWVNLIFYPSNYLSIYCTRCLMKYRDWEKSFIVFVFSKLPKADHILEIPWLGFLFIIVCKIIYFKVMNAANYFKAESSLNCHVWWDTLYVYTSLVIYICCTCWFNSRLDVSRSASW